MVLISDTASAPPFLRRAAGLRMSVMFGVSFTMTGMRVLLLAPARDHLDIFRHLADRGAHAALRHAVRAAEVELDAVAPRSPRPAAGSSSSSPPRRAPSARRSRARSGQSLLDLLDLAQVHVERPVGDQLDIVEADDPVAVDMHARRSAEETLTIGGSSPSVFHTTPPQPALKARTTLYSLSVGGAEASQNGFGDLMPTKSVRRSAMSASCSACAERAVDRIRPRACRPGTATTWRDPCPPRRNRRRPRRRSSEVVRLGIDARSRVARHSRAAPRPLLSGLGRDEGLADRP